MGRNISVPEKVTGTGSRLEVSGGIALADIGIIEGTIANPFGFLARIAAVAVELGAEELWIQTVFGNARLAAVTAARYATVTSGPYVIIKIPLP